jgi:hypothetical protein
VELRVAREDLRPVVYLEDVDEALFDRVKLPHPAGVPALRAKDVRGLEIQNSRLLATGRYDRVDAKDL